MTVQRKPQDLGVKQSSLVDLRGLEPSRPGSLVDYIHSLLPTENRSEVESQSETRNAQMLVTRILSVP